MASATTEELLTSIGDPALTAAIQSAVEECLAMANISVRCVGVSCIPSRELGNVTGLIGVHGGVTGYITVNVSETVAIETVSALLLEEYDSLDRQVIDGVGELTNMIAGGVKRGLAGTPWGFSHVTVPSMIVGQNYDIAFANGFRYVSMAFEHVKCKSIMIHDRLVRVAVSLIRL